jgi:hypothetical protein
MSGGVSISEHEVRRGITTLRVDEVAVVTVGGGMSAGFQVTCQSKWHGNGLSD